MATSKDDIKATYPLPVYNYRVEIGGEAVSFSEVSGLNIVINTTTYKESPVEGGSPGPRVMHMPAQGTPASLTLKKGLVSGTSVPALYEWIASAQTNQIEKKDVFIRLCDETGAPLVSWAVLDAFPTKLDAPTFGADSDDVAVESMELMASSVLIEES